MAEKADYVEPGVTCADVCEVLGQGIDGKRANQLSQPSFQIRQFPGAGGRTS